MTVSQFRNQIQNRNFLSPAGFNFTLSKEPKVSFFCTSATIPEISLGVAKQPSYLKDLDIPGEKLTYGDLTLRFLVDEDMSNYLEIFNWIKSITRIDGFDAAEGQATAWGKEIDSPMGEEKVFSDATLHVLNSAMNPNKEIQFTDCYPTGLTDVPFNTTLSDVDYVECTATFKFRKFDFVS